MAGYKVWRATSPGGPFGLIARSTGTTYSDIAVASRSTYWYMVKAYDRPGKRSAQSAVVSAMPN
ncbi:MAG: hypothetical protein M3163_02720 [Actinomycetota bacterium]|nr:hypothetical protein [Actinomycetota bacterium]